MAPRRGGGGGIHISSSSAGCPGAFKTDESIPIPYFVAWCLFFVVTLVTLIAAIKIRKKHVQAKQLLGWLYIVPLVFFLLGYALLIIENALKECDQIGYSDGYIFTLILQIFFRLGDYLLLCVVMFSVNNLLRKVVGNSPGFLKFVYAASLGLMAILTVAYIGVASYDNSIIISGHYYRATLFYQEEKLAVAYWALYWLVSLLAGALALFSMNQIRLQMIPLGDLAVWTFVLEFSMFIWSLFIIIIDAADLNNHYLGPETNEAFEWITDGFQAISFIAILFIAKSRALGGAEQHAFDDPSYPQPPDYSHAPIPAEQQYGYSKEAENQQYQYQQQQQLPVYQGAHVNGQRHVA